MTQPDDLKPCPLCGGKAVLHEESATIHCVRCCLETDEDYSCASAIRAWNTRTTPDLSRILKLAATRFALDRGAAGSEDYWGSLQTYRAALNAITPEDHQLLEAVLKE